MIDKQAPPKIEVISGPIDDRYRMRFSSVLREIAQSATSCLASIVFSQEADRSHAANLRAETIRLAGPSTPQPIKDAQFDVVHAVHAHLDHVRTFAIAILDPDSAGYGLATISRGAVEAAGRAWWLITAPDADELTRRWLRSHISNLKFRVSAPTHDPTATNEELAAAASNDELRTRLIAAAAGLGIVKPADLKMDYTTLARSVLDAVSGPGAGLHFYSELSSVAHSDPSGIASMLTTVGPHPDLPDAILYEHGMTTSMLMTVMLPIVSVHGKLLESVMQYFSIDLELQERWRVAMSAFTGVLEAEHAAMDGSLAEAGVDTERKMREDS